MPTVRHSSVRLTHLRLRIMEEIKYHDATPLEAIQVLGNLLWEVGHELKRLGVNCELQQAHLGTRLLVDMLIDDALMRSQAMAADLYRECAAPERDQVLDKVLEAVSREYAEYAPAAEAGVMLTGVMQMEGGPDGQ